MKKYDYAGVYLPDYEGKEVTVTAISEFTGFSSPNAITGCVAFDLSDGTHWLMDDMGAAKVKESLVGAFDIVYDFGWYVVSEDGTRIPAPYVL